MSVTGGAGDEVASVTRSRVTDAFLDRLDSSEDTKQIANDILRLWDRVVSIANELTQREAQLREYFESHPAKSEAEVLSEKIVEFATSLDKLSQSQRKNIESLIELTSTAEKLLETVHGFQKNAEQAVRDVRDAAKDELARAAAKLRMPKVLSVGVTLGLHIAEIAIATGILIALIVLIVRH